jgi:hypothetical protein
MADRVGRASALMAPLIDALHAHVSARDRLHGDDTPVPVLEPGRGRSREGRVWVCVRDGRSAGDTRTPPAACYLYSLDLKGAPSRAHLKGFAEVLHADGFAGFDDIYRARGPDGAARVLEAACRAHVRRKFFDLAAAGSAPIAEGAFARIAALYAVEARIRGVPPEERRRARPAEASPKVAALKDRLEADLARLPAKTPSPCAPVAQVQGAFEFRGSTCPPSLPTWVSSPSRQGRIASHET